MENPGFISEDLDVTYVAAEQFWENIVKLQVWSKVHLNIHILNRKDPHHTPPPDNLSKLETKIFLLSFRSYVVMM